MVTHGVDRAGACGRVPLFVLETVAFSFFRRVDMSNKALPRTGNNRVKHDGPTYRQLRKIRKRAAIKSKRRNRNG